MIDTRGAKILAVKPSTYFMGEVPELHSLVENMTSQQLAHFSRVLALLVFEPEYRQLMESAHVLRCARRRRRRRICASPSLLVFALSFLSRLCEGLLCVCVHASMDLV